MTTHTLPASEENELFDLMAELDQELKADKNKPKAKRVAAPVRAPFEVQWHPFGLKFMLRHQTCACGAEFQNVLGLFLVDMTRNGATRMLRHEGPLPSAYRTFSATAEEEDEALPCCPWCYKPEEAQELIPAEPDRPVTPEERKELADLDRMLGE